MVRPIANPLRAADLLAGSGRVPNQRVRIRFLTPTRIRGGGQTLATPEFHVLIKRLRDRVNAIGWFYGGVTLDLDYAEYGRRGRVRPYRRMPVTYEGDIVDIEEFLPLLRLGEWIHVGKHAVWGNGQFQIGFPEGLSL